VDTGVPVASLPPLPVAVAALVVHGFTGNLVRISSSLSTLSFSTITLLFVVQPVMPWFRDVGPVLESGVGSDNCGLSVIPSEPSVLANDAPSTWMD
jgi:hypothetical protein